MSSYRVRLSAMLVGILLSVACQQGGLVYSDEAASQDLRLFAPILDNSAYLVDRQGELVHSWEIAAPAHAAYLLDSGNLLVAARAEQASFTGGGQAGRLQEVAWDGSVLWDYSIADEHRLQHHDIEPLPNGNVLAIIWERIPRSEALAAGRDPEKVPADGIWSDAILEIEPIRPDGGRIVWQWRAWEHLVQDRSAELAGWGSVADAPSLIDVNAGLDAERLQREESPEELERLRTLGYLGAGGSSGTAAEPRPGEGGADWLHTNSVDYNAELDQILLSVRNLSEIWIIDHSTTTAEAASDAGGRYGRGGSLLYRYGNPTTTGGSEIDQALYVQHDARWIDAGLPGAGNLLLFNNGDGRPEGQYSSVEELALPQSAAGDYLRGAGGAFAAPERVWSFRGTGELELYSGRLSGAERMANGHTLICEGESGRFLEVTADGDLVWEYVNPFGGTPPRGARAPRPGAGAGDKKPAAGSGGPPPGGPPPGGPSSGSAVFRVSPVRPELAAR